MEITEVKVFPVRDKKLRAFVSIVFDGSFMVNDIKVIQGKDGCFISMPSRRKKNGKFKDVAHPLNNETRKSMENRILSEYRRVVEGVEDPELKVERVPGPIEEAPPVTEAPLAAPEEAGDRSLDEVAEAHLKDSFWGT